MKKNTIKIFATPLICAGLVIIGAAANQITTSSKIVEKDNRIDDLERALDVMEEANTSLKNENEAQQIMIDNLEYDLEQAK